MSNNYIPNADADLGPYARNLLTQATAHTAQLGLVAADLTTLSARADDWDNDYPAHLAAQSAAASAVTTKNNTRAALEAAIHDINTKVQAKPGKLDDFIRGAGLPVHDATHSRVAAPTTRPVLMVDTSERLEHKIVCRDESTPNTRAKPPGVAEIEIWCKIGAPPPADPSECRLMTASGRNHLTITHNGADAGKPAHYLGRWKNTRGETGPWSETVIATIAG